MPTLSPALTRVPGLRVIPAGLLLGALLGCGGAKDAAPPASAQAAAEAPAAGSWDPCALVTREEVQQALGWAVAKATPYTNGDLGHCKYESEKSNMAVPFEQLDVGLLECFTNLPCVGSNMPKGYSSSEAMVEARKKAYRDSGNEQYLEMVTIAPVEGLGVPAIMHDMATLLSLEMATGSGRIAYVSAWGSEEATRSLAEKVLTRLK